MNDEGGQKKIALPILPFITIALLYASIYGINIFSNLNNSDFMGIDESSIISSLKQLLEEPVYNMNASYHSKYYGWTYFSLNFLILQIAQTFSSINSEDINFLMRFSHFLIGLGASICTFILMNKIFKPLVSIALTVFFITCPIVAHYLNEVHPESLGLLLQIVSLLLLSKAYQCSSINSHYFYAAVLSLSLSSLSKQSFLVVSIFLSLIFIYFFYAKTNSWAKRCVPWKQLFRTFNYSILIFFAIFFIVHPYAFIQPNLFIAAQLGLGTEHAARSFLDVLPMWIDVLKENSIILLNFIFLLLTPFLWKRQRLLALSLIFTNIIIIIFIYRARLWIVDTYTFPVFIFCYLNVIFILKLGISQITRTRYNNFANFIIGISLCILIISNITYVLFKEQSRYWQQGTRTTDLVYNHLKELDVDVKIAYAPNVVIPEKLMAKSCHAWQGCGSYDDLLKYDPDMVVFYPPEFQSSYAQLYDSEAYKKFVIENKYQIHQSFRPDFVTKKVCPLPLAFNILSALETGDFFKQPLSCLIAYSQMIDNFKNRRHTNGGNILIYSKVKL